VNWTTLRQIEPRLLDLEQLAIRAHEDGTPWLDFWISIPPQFRKLVGWSGLNEKGQDNDSETITTGGTSSTC